MSDERLLLRPTTLLAVLAAVAIAGGAWYLASRTGQQQAGVQRGEIGEITLGDPERIGVAVAPELPAPEPRSDCAALFRLPDLAPLSDKGVLDATGFYDGSPILLFAGEVPLTPHARTQRCDNGFAHGPNGPVVRVDGADPTTVDWRAALTSEVLAVRRRGRAGPQELLYVHPGTRVVVPVHSAWKEAWGPPVLRLAAVSSIADQPATMSVGDTQVALPSEGGPLRAELTAHSTEGMELVLSSPPDGPILLVTDWVLGGSPVASAVVGNLEGALSAPTTSDAAEHEGPARPSVSRMGTPRSIPLTLPVESPNPCGVMVPAATWSDLSDLRLFERYGYKFASPLRVLEEGDQLQPHARGQHACDGSFAHPPGKLVLHPSPPGAGNRRYTLSFDPTADVAVDSRGGEQEHIAWAYPGTRLQWSFADALETGPHEVVVDVVSFGGTGEATLARADQRTVIEAGLGEGRVAVAGPESEGPWLLSLEVPPGGPIVLVRGFDVRPVGSTDQGTARVTAVDGSLPLSLEAGGFVALVPEGIDATATATASGLSFTVRSPGPGARLCSPWAEGRADLVAEAELAVPQLTRGDAGWKTLRVEDGWVDAEGEPVRVDGRIAQTTHPLTEMPSSRATWTFPRPPHAERGRVCFRFAESTGQLQLTHMALTAR